MELCTFLICDPTEEAAVLEVTTPAEWSLRLIDDPSERFWFGPNYMQTIQRPSALRPDLSELKRGRLAVVKCSSRDEGENAADLLRACCDIIDSDPTHQVYSKSSIQLPDQPEHYPALFKTRGFFEQFAHFSDLPVALRLTTNCWADRSIAYAAHKLLLSYRFDRVTWWSMHPKHGQKFSKTSALHRDHVGTAFAVNAAFSAIEELGLEVRSSAKLKRFDDNDLPAWNPKVLLDIQDRLLQAGIDPNEDFEWVQRGAPSDAESGLKPRFRLPSPYADGDVVRDLRIKITDAIHYCSVLRNFMTAHRFADATSSIGPYEVYNVQSVARRLILGRGECWPVESGKGSP